MLNKPAVDFFEGAMLGNGSGFDFMASMGIWFENFALPVEEPVERCAGTANPERPAGRKTNRPDTKTITVRPYPMVWHTGKTTPSPWVTARMQEQNPTAMPPVKLLQTSDAGAVVSLLEKGDSQFLVIVNRDHQHPTKLTLITDDSVKKVQKDGTLIPASTYAYTMEIDPGDVAIYTWKK